MEGVLRTGPILGLVTQRQYHSMSVGSSSSLISHVVQKDRSKEYAYTDLSAIYIHLSSGGVPMSRSSKKRRSRALVLSTPL